MSWRYGSFQSKFYYSEVKIDFTAEEINYEQFLLQEFFTADLQTAVKISDYYFATYGAHSLAYINRKKTGWVQGDYHLTKLMRKRIISIMPKFLSDSAKYKLGLHEFMASIKKSIKAFQSKQKTTFRDALEIKGPQEIISIFELEYEKIQGLNFQNFRFNILTEEEKEEALEISKYILMIKLQKAFEQTMKDFSTFLPFMSKFRRGNFSAFYATSFFNLKVDITNTSFIDLEIPKFKIKEAETRSKFKLYSDSYLAYELVSMHEEANKKLCNSFLNANDIQLFFSQYEKLSYGQSKVEKYDATFQGEGGILTLMAQIIPLKLLKKSILMSVLKLLIYIILLISFISLAIDKHHGDLFVFSISLGGILILGPLIEELKQFISLILKFRFYG